MIYDLKLAVPCAWGAWEVGQCSATCGGGIRKDTREIIQEALHGAPVCDPTGHQREESCNTHVCPRKTIVKIMLI